MISDSTRVFESPEFTKLLSQIPNSSKDATTYISGAFYRAGASAPDFIHENVLDNFTQKAIAFIETHEESHIEQPFFLYFPLTAPHTPWLPKSEFRESSDAGEYGDFVVQVDFLVGEVIAHLENNGLLENTIIIFSSDNGPVWFDEDEKKYNHKSTGPLKGMKVDYWEGGSRIPLIFSWPKKFDTNAKSSHLIGFTDFMATFADIVGDKTFEKESFDSYSFLPVLMNSEYKQQVRSELIIEDKVFRQDNMKFIKGSGLGGLHRRYNPNENFSDPIDDSSELYDLKSDIGEKVNLYSSQKTKAKLMEQRLTEELNSGSGLN